MKVLGLIVEYNPFHNGHLYHIEQSKKLSGAEYVVCVMSGNFIQRGEPAIVSKWARARMALLSGADLVIELPVVYAMSSAEFFAHGAVKILDSIGVVSHICFGSENGRLDELDMIAGVLSEEPELYRLILKEQLDKGLSYPASREIALRRYFSRDPGLNINFDMLVNSSNNILGIEYLKALKRLGSRILPLTIRRIQNSYNSETITGKISSATSIRKNILYSLSHTDNIKFPEALPDSSFSVLEQEFNTGRGPVFPHDFEHIILSTIRRSPSDLLKALPDISEGLENRIKAASDDSGAFEELLEKTGTRRYTRTRIQRILFNSLLGLSAKEFARFNQTGGPQYARVLGFNRKGRELLGYMKSSSSLPIMVKTADFKISDNPLIRRMLEIESLATDLYVLGYKNPEFRKAGQDFTQNIIRV